MLQLEALEMVHSTVCRRLATCPHKFYFNRVKWEYSDGILRLQGQVPTFYLKQILQTLLRDIENVERVENDVQVINSCGLSST